MTKTLAFFLLLGIWATAGIIGYWVIDRDPPAKVILGEVLTPSVGPGDWLRVRYHVRRKDRCRVNIEQIMVDKDGMRARLEDVNYAVDPVDEWVGLAAQVPSYFVGGEARYHVIRAYYCNPLQRMLDWPIPTIGPMVSFTVRREDAVNAP